MFRIIFGISANTEQEERTFNTFKTTTSLTSNFHPDHVILNGIIRLQGKQKFNAEYCHKSESIVTKFAKGLPRKLRSTISYWIIEDHQREWQAHLEKISDYILEEGIWWEETYCGIVFNDNKHNDKTNLVPHHFRTWNLVSENKHLQNCWEHSL